MLFFINKKLPKLLYGIYPLIFLWLMASVTYFFTYESIQNNQLEIHSSAVQTLMNHTRKTVNSSMASNISIMIGNIITEIKIRFDIMNLIEYTSIDRTVFNKYILTTNTSNTECKPSLYNLQYHDCCMAQFAIFYLYSLGFKSIKQIRFDPHLIDVPFNDKTMWNKHNTDIGCFGLQIQLNYRKRQSQRHDWTGGITHKTRSYSIIMTYCIQHNIEKYCKLWLPTTYDLQISEQRIEFFRQLPCDNKPNYEWLLKTDIHSGNGIHFIKNSNFLRQLYLDKLEQNASNPQCIIDEELYDIDGNISQQLVGKSVGQKLVKNTLRINNCTFHIRAYLMVANFNHPLIVLYTGAVIARSTDPSEIRSNAHHSEHIMRENGIPWVLNLQQFAQYFEEHGVDVNIRNIVDQIKNMTKVIFLSVLENYKPLKPNIQYYTTPALDFLIKEDMQVQYLDFNSVAGTGHVPNCFEVKDGNYAVLKDIWQCHNAKRIMEEMVNIELEIAMKKKNGDQISSLDSMKTFEIIVWK